MTSDKEIQIENLTKRFKDLVAVDNLNLEVKRGEIFGFLGPNGAGKTTTIRMLLGLTYPDRGSILINGLDVFESRYLSRKGLGFLPERVGFYNNLTAKQTLEFYCDMKGYSRDEVGKLLEMVGLEKFANKKVGTFSRGMVQLLGVAQAFMGEPRLLILDEPAGGLDPRWIRMVKDSIRDAKKRGATIFFSSHILGEVEKLCDRVAIIHKGRLMAEDTIENLSKHLEMKPKLWLQLDHVDEKAVKIASEIDGVSNVHLVDNWLMVECDYKVRGAVMQMLPQAGYVFLDIRSEEPALEDMFLKITEREEGQ